MLPALNAVIGSHEPKATAVPLEPGESIGGGKTVRRTELRSRKEHATVESPD